METERSKDRSGICKACEPDIAVASADGWAELLLPELDRLQARDIEVAVRGDAAFARPELYESLEERETRHAIRLPANGNLERRIAQLLKWPVGRPSHRPVVRYKSFFYQAASWKRARRVVAKVEFHLLWLFRCQGGAEPVKWRRGRGLCTQKQAQTRVCKAFGPCACLNPNLKMEIPARRQVTAARYLLALFLLGLMSVWALREPYDWVWNTSFQGFAAVLPTTAWAALKLWAFWGLATAVAGLVLIRIEPKLSLCDAIVGGAACTWVFAYLAGNLLGPIGLFRSWTIWLILIAAVIWLIRNPPALEFGWPSTGQKLALAACLLMAVGMLPLELGSPVPPYMDALCCPAAVQRILTFCRYLPFDNNPYGYWGPMNQTPGAELLYAFLGFGAGVKLGVLAETGVMVPMAGLTILGTYRLGRALMGDMAGGMAAVLLFASNLMALIPILRGTQVVFVLVPIGLAFFADSDRRPLRTAIGALVLGTAVATHALIGAFALATTVGLLVLRLFERNALREAICLTGAVLVALPMVPIALEVKLPYPILPLIQFVGVTVIWRASRGLTPRPNRQPVLSLARLPVLLGLALFIWGTPQPAHAMWIWFPLLAALCIGGLLLALLSEGQGIHVAALALLVGAAVDYFTNSTQISNSQLQFGLEEITRKVGQSWAPYFLIFPAMVPFVWLHQRGLKSLAVAALFALVVFPWYQHAERGTLDYGHSLAEQWACHWNTAKVGWWGSSPDHRWLQSPTEFKLIDAVRAEIAAGRITPQTHIVHVTSRADIYNDVLLHSLFTGVNDDIYVEHPNGDLSKSGYVGSRMYPLAALPAALAKKPPYVVQQTGPPVALPPSEYREIFHSHDGIRLWRLQ